MERCFFPIFFVVNNRIQHNPEGNSCDCDIVISPHRSSPTPFASRAPFPVLCCAFLLVGVSPRPQRPALGLPGAWEFPFPWFSPTYTTSSRFRTALQTKGTWLEIRPLSGFSLFLSLFPLHPYQFSLRLHL